MAYENSLRTRHHEILRLHFLGRSNREIAMSLNLHPQTITCILKSPLAQAELTRLKAEAEKSLVNVPLRQQLLNDLNGSAMEALHLRRGLMNDNNINLGVRERISQHFMDRVIFPKNEEDSTEGSYRDILRKMSEIERKLGMNAVPIEAEAQPA
jgi:IS30 family transposase